MRVLLRTLSPLLGLGLAALGVVVVIEVVAAWVRPGSAHGIVAPWPAWQAGLRELTWADTTVIVVSICVGVLGLLLLLVALLARRHDVALTSPAPEMTVSTSPRVLARLVGRTVRASDEVAAATVSASRRKVVVKAQGWPDSAVGLDGLRAEVRSTVDGLLDELSPVRRPKVTVAGRSPKEAR